MVLRSRKKSGVLVAAALILIVNALVNALETVNVFITMVVNNRSTLLADFSFTNKALQDLVDSDNNHVTLLFENGIIVLKEVSHRINDVLFPPAFLVFLRIFIFVYFSSSIVFIIIIRVFSVLLAEVVLSSFNVLTVDLLRFLLILFIYILRVIIVVNIQSEVQWIAQIVVSRDIEKVNVTFSEFVVVAQNRRECSIKLLLFVNAFDNELCLHFFRKQADNAILCLLVKSRNQFLLVSKVEILKKWFIFLIRLISQLSCI